MIKQCESHVELFPDDQRIRNNLAKSLAECGHVTRAPAVFSETIERFPGNFYARAARCRVLCLQAKSSDSDAESLLSLEPKQASDLTKAAQAFAHRGEDRRIEWAYQQADSRGWLQNPAPDVAVLLNLQATCRARAGDTKSAKHLWKDAEKMAPGATLAGENLDDTRQPAGHQWGPAFFGLRDSFDQEQQQTLAQLIAPESPGEISEGWLDKVLNRFLKQHPSVEAIANRMLQSGDADCQQFAVLLVKQSRNPEIRKVVLDYAQGSRGTDTIRQQLASELSQRGELPSSVITMHVRGKVDQVEFISFEITDEPSIPDGRSDEVCELMAEAVDAMHDGQPDEPDVLNNLAMSLQLQSRMTKANRLIDEVIPKTP